MGKASPHNGLIPSTAPHWPLEEPLSNERLEERRLTIWNYPDHSSPLAVLCLPGLWALTPLLQRTAMEQEVGYSVQLEV